MYWQPVVTGMFYCLSRTQKIVPFASPFGANPNVVPDNLSILNVTFEYSPGYRIGARYTLPKICWDLDASYTRLSKTGNDSFQAADGVFIDTLWDAINAVNSSEASASMKVKLDLINATIGKTLTFPHCFKMRPNFGL